jgi:hypothetical protein
LSRDDARIPLLDRRFDSKFGASLDKLEYDADRDERGGTGLPQLLPLSLTDPASDLDAGVTDGELAGCRRCVDAASRAAAFSRMGTRRGAPEADADDDERLEVHDCLRPIVDAAAACAAGVVPWVVDDAVDDVASLVVDAALGAVRALLSGTPIGGDAAAAKSWSDSRGRSDHSVGPGALCASARSKVTTFGGGSAAVLSATAAVAVVAPLAVTALAVRADDVMPVKPRIGISMPASPSSLSSSSPSKLNSSRSDKLAATVSAEERETSGTLTAFGT